MTDRLSALKDREEALIRELASYGNEEWIRNHPLQALLNLTTAVLLVAWVMAPTYVSMAIGSLVIAAYLAVFYLFVPSALHLKAIIWLVGIPRILWLTHQRDQVRNKISFIKFKATIAMPGPASRDLAAGLREGDRFASKTPDRPLAIHVD